jgi:hypothetical protein
LPSFYGEHPRAKKCRLRTGQRQNCFVDAVDIRQCFLKPSDPSAAAITARKQYGERPQRYDSSKASIFG